eukprot:5345595-Pyramimonas_sp.AAC.1
MVRLGLPPTFAARPSARVPGGAPVPRCPGAWVPGCPDAQVSGCPCARVPGGPGARMPRCPVALYSPIAL